MPDFAGEKGIKGGRMNKWLSVSLGLIFALILIGSMSIVMAQSVEGTGPGQGVTDPGQAWTTTTITPLHWGYYVHYDAIGIAADQDSRAHISYSTERGGLGYATNKQGCWSASTVYDRWPTHVARENSIAIDAVDRPHISFSYSDGGNENLMYATNSAGTWSMTTVDSALSVGLENAIAVDHSGYLHISHWMWNNGSLKYSTNRTGAWTTELIAEADWNRTAIAIDSADHVHIAYSNDGNLMVTTNATGSWISTTIGYGFSPSLAIDSQDHLHISFSAGSNLKYASNASGAWAISTVAAGVAADRNHAIALDRENHAHISYYDDRLGDLMYANDVSGAWTTVTVDSEGYVGRSNAIAVDGNGKVHISYRDDGISPPELNAIWGSSPEDVFAVGADCAILHFDGHAWGRMAAAACPYSDLTALWGSSAQDVFAVGPSHTILHHDGAEWLRMDTGDMRTGLQGVWGSSSQDVYAVGYDSLYNGETYSWEGRVWHYDGSAWTNVVTGTIPSLRAVWGSGANDVYAVGEKGTILHYDGATWRDTNTTGITKTLNAIWGASPTDVFAAGDSGTMLHYDGLTWNSMPSSAQYDNFIDLWGSSGADVYGVTRFGYGSLMHFDGRAWSEIGTSGEYAYYTSYQKGIWGFAPSDIWLVGRSYLSPVGQVFRFDGATQTPMLSASLKYATNADPPACDRSYLPLVRRR